MGGAPAAKQRRERRRWSPVRLVVAVAVVLALVAGVAVVCGMVG
jgi:hypothetical protein